MESESYQQVINSFVSRLLDFLQDKKDNTEDEDELRILNKLIGVLEDEI